MSRYASRDFINAVNDAEFASALSGFANIWGGSDAVNENYGETTADNDISPTTRAAIAARKAANAAAADDDNPLGQTASRIRESSMARISSILEYITPEGQLFGFKKDEEKKQDAVSGIENIIWGGATDTGLVAAINDAVEGVISLGKQKPQEEVSPADLFALSPSPTPTVSSTGVDRTV